MYNAKGFFMNVVKSCNGVLIEEGELNYTFMYNRSIETQILFTAVFFGVIIKIVHKINIDIK